MRYHTQLFKFLFHVICVGVLPTRVLHVREVPMEVRRGYWALLDWSYKWLTNLGMWVLETDHMSSGKAAGS